jgi:hypothetical protein
MPAEKTRADFFEPMLLLATNSLPDGNEWEYELKLDGYRVIGFKSNGKVHLRSRNNKDFAVRYQSIASALQKLPDDTVIDGEVVAFDESGRPSFNTLQNFGSSTVPIFYYVFDLLILGGRDVRCEALHRRRELLKTKVLLKLHEPIAISHTLEPRTSLQICKPDSNCTWTSVSDAGPSTLSNETDLPIAAGTHSAKLERHRPSTMRQLSLRQDFLRSYVPRSHRARHTWQNAPAANLRVLLLLVAGATTVLDGSGRSAIASAGWMGTIFILSLRRHTGSLKRWPAIRMKH